MAADSSLPSALMSGCRKTFRIVAKLPLGVPRRLYHHARNGILKQRTRQFVRLLTCPGMRSVDPRNMDPGWLGKKTTPGEKAVIGFLCKAAFTETPKILHIGIGNGDFGRSLSAIGADIAGVSIHGGEIANARNVYHSTHLVNKYAASELASMLGDSEFHWAVDVNLFTYACCWGHALQYLWFLNARLAEGGSIVTHAGGLAYAATSFMLTPWALEQIARVAGMRVTTHPDGVILMAKEGKRGRYS